MTDGAQGYREPTTEEREALEDFAEQFGRDWRETLSGVYWYNARIWEHGKKPGTGNVLHGIRNTFGPTWLFDVFKVEPRFRWTRSGGFIGQRIEISPALDLWMRGARFGVIVQQSTRHKPGELMRLRVRMDHPQVKRLAVIRVADIHRTL